MPFELNITATFTTEPIRSSLEFWLEKLGTRASIHFSDYSQVLQQALNPMSESSRNVSGFNLFLVRPEDIAGARSAPSSLDEIADALAGLAERSRATQIVIFCPHPDRTEETSACERATIERLRKLPNVEPVGSAEWTELYPVLQVFDTEAEASTPSPPPSGRQSSPPLPFLELRSR